MKPKPEHPVWIFVVFPAIAMLLGWGLRGYIGGGPFGALIPGCFVALSLSMLLGYRMETAAMAALFGAVGIGYGGDMTYGQTLGFLRESDTVLWGLLGCLVKGGIWGLFGGAVLGAGLTRDRYDVKTLTVAFVLTVAAFYVGIKLINDPKLIYFSNRLDKPRDESWAGLLFAAITFLGYLRYRGSAEAFAVPFRFALWGTVGGALGFSGGALWMVFGPQLPVPQQWIGWWKAMEFSFGLILGAALGYCAYLNRERLYVAGQEGETPPAAWGPVGVFFAFVATVFIAYPVVGGLLPEGIADSRTLSALLVRDLFRVLFGFVFFGGLCIILGLRSILAAWQIAVTLTVFHCVLDYVRDLDNPERFGYTLPVPVQLLILLIATGAVGYLTFRFQQGPQPIRRIYLLVLWACYAVACVRSFFLKDFFFPPEGESLLSVITQNHASLFFVHGTFTVSAIITTWFILRLGDSSDEAVTANSQHRR
ncbi:MAG: hypothetical protein KJ060_19480 [Candidatus Hydrogenedentes bacterium]|nr:hypothetical protein [Candidatus Hydrogenedentota bacterium]